MNTKKVVQVTTLGFALIMLTSFVLYSQMTQTRTIAPGSKSAILTVEKKARPHGSTPAQNSIKTEASDTIIWGSKSQAPLLKMPPELLETKLGIDASNPPAAIQQAKPEYSLAATNIPASTINKP